MELKSADEKGYTWVLLRGLGREKGHWGSFIDQFSAEFSGDEVLVIDLPGTGDQRELASPKTVDAIFTSVREQAISRARKQSQFKVLAVSLGGMVAMEWMRQKSSDLAACVLVNSSLQSLSPFYLRLRWQVWKDFAQLLSLPSAREREKQIVDLVINNPEAREVALPQWIKLAVERPIARSTALNQLVAAAFFKGLSTPSAVPTLLLNGLGDRLVDPSCSAALHEHFAWPIHRHPWAGHDLVWDDPKWVLAKIRAWNASANASH